MACCVRASMLGDPARKGSFTRRNAMSSPSGSRTCPRSSSSFVMASKFSSACGGMGGSGGSSRPSSRRRIAAGVIAVAGTIVGGIQVDEPAEAIRMMPAEPGELIARDGMADQHHFLELHRIHHLQHVLREARRVETEVGLAGVAGAAAGHRDDAMLLRQQRRELIVAVRRGAEARAAAGWASPVPPKSSTSSCTPSSTRDGVRLVRRGVAPARLSESALPSVAGSGQVSRSAPRMPGNASDFSK